MSPAIQDPMPLVRRAQKHDGWYDEQPPSRPSHDYRDSIDSLDLVSEDENGWLPGLLAGLGATVLGLGAAALVANASGARARIEEVIGGALTRHAFDGPTTTAIGIGVMLLAGAILGAAVSHLTRHVVRTMPMVIFGLLFAPALWFAVDVLVLRRFAPHAAQLAPLGATLLGAGVFGAALAFAVPLRRIARAKRRRPAENSAKNDV